MRDRVRCVADASIAALLPRGASLARVLSSVDGYLFPHEALFLAHLARSAPGSGAIVEIGSFMGRSTLCMAIGAERRGTAIHAIDPHVYGTEDVLRRNLLRHDRQGLVRVHVARSVDVARSWEEKIRLLFVDGAHDLENVTADVEVWLPHVEDGGFVLLHDATELSQFAAPELVATRLLRPERSFVSTGRIGSIRWGRRAGGTPWTPRPRGARVLDPLLRAMKRVRAPS